MSGEERPKKAWYKKWWVWVIVVVVAAAVGGMNKGGGGVGNGASGTTGSGSAETEVEEAKPKAIAISAKAYYEAYESNEVSADARFKDKPIAVTGIVSSVDKTLGTVYVNLKGDEYFGSVMCSLQNENDAARLTKGQSVTLVGTGDGKTIFPEVDDCVVK